MRVRFQAPPALAGALLVFLGLLATLLPVITAFALPVFLPALLVVGALLTVYIATMFSLRRGGWVLLLLLAGAWAFVCLQWLSMLRVGAQVALSEIMNQLALGVDIVSEMAAPVGLTEGERAAGCTLFLVVLVTPVLLLYGWSIIRLSAAAPCVMASLPFFAVSMILMDRPPSLFAVLCAIAFWALLVLPQSVRHASPRRGAALTLLYLPVVAALCGVVLLLSPRESYVRAAWPDVLREQLTNLRAAVSKAGEQRPSLAETAERIDASRPDARVNLSGLGPRRTTGTTVLEVLDEAGGTLYLRGSTLGRYDGANWSEPVEDPPETAEDIADVTARAAASGVQRQLTIRHLSSSTQIAYVPYYAVAGEAEIGEGYARPLERTDQYAWRYAVVDDPAGAGTAGSDADLAYRAWAQTAYTDVPESLAAELRALAASAGIDAGAPRETLVEQVAACIRQAAYYDLEAARAPSDTDFILYFLTESRRGYCVHFASAATAMLQALGVPARYVSGYLVRAEAGTWTAVTDDNAHAWVEVYYDGFGWVPVEVTGSTAAPVETEAPTEIPTAAPTETPDAPGDTGTPAPGTAANGTEPPATPGTGETDTTPEPDATARQDGGALTAGGDPPAEQDGQGDGTPAGQPGGPSPLYLLLLLPPLGVCGLALRRRAMLARRAQRLQSGGNKRRILAAWRALQQLVRFGLAIPAQLEAIALEARFSDHPMTDAQRDEMLRFLTASTERLARELPLAKRLLAKYVFVLF